MFVIQEGQSFNKVAQEYSEDKAKGNVYWIFLSQSADAAEAGGSLGWMVRGSMVVRLVQNPSEAIINQCNLCVL